jgi:hypothetical protein
MLSSGAWPLSKRRPQRPCTASSPWTKGGDALMAGTRTASATPNTSVSRPSSRQGTPGRADRHGHHRASRSPSSVNTGIAMAANHNACAVQTAVPSWATPSRAHTRAAAAPNMAIGDRRGVAVAATSRANSGGAIDRVSKAATITPTMQSRATARARDAGCPLSHSWITILRSRPPPTAWARTRALTCADTHL